MGGEDPVAASRRPQIRATVADIGQAAAAFEEALHVGLLEAVIEDDAVRSDVLDAKPARGELGLGGVDLDVGQAETAEDLVDVEAKAVADDDEPHPVAAAVGNPLLEAGTYRDARLHIVEHFAAAGPHHREDFLIETADRDRAGIMLVVPLSPIAIGEGVEEHEADVLLRHRTVEIALDHRSGRRLQNNHPFTSDTGHRRARDDRPRRLVLHQQRFDLVECRPESVDLLAVARPITITKRLLGLISVPQRLGHQGGDIVRNCDRFSRFSRLDRFSRFSRRDIDIRRHHPENGGDSRIKRLLHGDHIAGGDDDTLQFGKSATLGLEEYGLDVEVGITKRDQQKVAPNDIRAIDRVVFGASKALTIAKTGATTTNLQGLTWTASTTSPILISSGGAGILNLERCSIIGSNAGLNRGFVSGPSGAVVLTCDGCLFDWTGSAGGGSAYIYLGNAASTALVRNCVFTGTGPQNTFRKHNSGTFTVYNSYLTEGSVAFLSGTGYTGNNNATDATVGLPGTGNHHSETYSVHFDTVANNAFPKEGQTPDLTVAGDATNLAELGYYGNELAEFDACIGAIPLS